MNLDLHRSARGLGVLGLALGVPAVVVPRVVARLSGRPDDAGTRRGLRLFGARELGSAAALLAGPPAAVWSRVAGDAADLTVLAKDRRRRPSDRTRLAATTCAVLAVTALDAWVAVRVLRSRHRGTHGRPQTVSSAVTVNGSPDDIYARWRRLEDLPQFMQHVESVTPDGDGRYRWSVRAPVRGRAEWTAEVTEDEPGRRIAWRSLEGADVDNSGEVDFAPSPDGEATEVRVRLGYAVPGGPAGRLVARMLGEHPDQQVQDDLRRFKQVVETGRVVRSDARPDGVDAAGPAHDLAGVGSTR